MQLLSEVNSYLIHVLIFTIAILLFSCSDQDVPQPKNNEDSVNDNDGNKYTTQLMDDGNLWLTQNLNVNMPNSWCYDEDPTNCSIYGRLYTLETAKLACQSLGKGWRLPTVNEWENMVKQYGGDFKNSTDKGETAYNALISGGPTKFNATLGGIRFSDGDFRDLDITGVYWTATKIFNNQAFYYSFF